MANGPIIARGEIEIEIMGILRSRSVKSREKTFEECLSLVKGEIWRSEVV